MDIARRTERMGCIGVTAPTRGSGSSTLASNLGMLCAELGSKALVVDADLERGSLTNQLNTKFRAGLAEVLTGSAKLEDAVVSFDGTTMDFLPSSGLPSPLRNDLLASARMDAFLRQACKVYDAVIIDLPPLLPVGEVLALTPLLDGVILVVEAGKTTTDLLATVVNLFGRAQSKLLGFVLTNTVTC